MNETVYLVTISECGKVDWDGLDAWLSSPAHRSEFNKLASAIRERDKATRVYKPRGV
jgi:hypothetical protein